MRIMLPFLQGVSAAYPPQIVNFALSTLIRSSLSFTRQKPALDCGSATC